MKEWFVGMKDRNRDKKIVRFEGQQQACMHAGMYDFR